MKDHESELVTFLIKNDWGVVFLIDGEITILLVSCILITTFLLVVFFATKNRYFLKEFEIEKAEFGLKKNKITLKPNETDKQIAFRIWVELSTRKIGIPIDFEHDVIAEIYSSWYEFFKITRDLIKEIPASKMKRKSTENIVNLSIDVLNDGVRPHLTEWQARFHRWYEASLQRAESSITSPQEIQKLYPKYSDLVEDMEIVNNRLIAYKNSLRKLF